MTTNLGESDGELRMKRRGASGKVARKKNPLGPTTEWANDQRMGEPNNHPLIEHTKNK